MNSKLLFLLIVPVFVLGCVQSSNNFNVDYKADYSSGAGTRTLDIVYAVENGKIVYCDGTYTSPSTAAQRTTGDFNNNVDPCQLEKLLAGQYNIPWHPITEIGLFTQTEGKVTEGPSHYSWKVISWTEPEVQIADKHYYSIEDINQIEPLGNCTIRDLPLASGGYQSIENFYSFDGAVIGTCSTYSGPGSSGGWKGGCTPKSLEEQLTDYPYHRAKYFCNRYQN